MKLAPLRARSTALMRKAIRFKRQTSMASVMNSAKVAIPSWVSVVRGDPKPRLFKLGCSRPFSIVAACTRPSCSASCLTSCLVNFVLPRIRRRFALAAAFEAKSGSTTISKGCAWKTGSSRKRRMLANSSDVMVASGSGVFRMWLYSSIDLMKCSAADRLVTSVLPIESEGCP